MKMPVSFEQFVKDPIKGLFFMALCAVAFLYIETRVSYNSQLNNCDTRTTELDIKVTVLEGKLYERDSLLARTAAKLDLLYELGHVK